MIGNVRRKRVDFAETRFVPQSYYDALDASRKPRSGDLLYTLVGSFGIPVIVSEDRPFCVQRHIGILRPCANICLEFLAWLMESNFVFEQANACATGIAQKTIPLSGLRKFVLPLPPLAEQRRITARVNALMSLCDRLEAVHTEREARRDRLTVSGLARLNTLDPDGFKDDARFALNVLPALTTRSDQVKEIRRTILRLSVHGKLVRQIESEGVAIAFDPGAPTTAAQPFAIPQNWRWSRLHALGRLRGGGTPSKSRDDFWNGSIPWISPKDMKVDYLHGAKLNVTPAALAESAAQLIETGSILFVVRGMILIHSFPVAVSRVKLTINQDMKALELKKPEMAEFILRALKGMQTEMLRRVQRSTHGTCRLEGSDYSDFLVPIPPLGEQRRIIARVDELMTLCDRLEASIQSTEEHRSGLLASILNEALQPVAEQDEAA